MKTKWYLFIFLGLSILTVIVLLSQFFLKKTHSLPEFKVNNINNLGAIVLTDESNRSVKLINKNGKWLVNGNSKVRHTMMKDLTEALEKMYPEAPVNKSAVNPVLKQMVNHSIRVDLYKKKKKQAYKSIIVGGGNHEGNGTYMLLEKNGKTTKTPYVIKLPGYKGYLTYRFSTNINEWKDKTLFSYMPQEIEYVQVHYLQEDSLNSYTLYKSDENYMLSKVPPNKKTVANNSKAASIYSKFIKLSAERFLNEDSKKDSTMQHAKYLDLIVKPKNDTAKILHVYFMPLGEGSVYGTDDNGKPYTHDMDRLYAYDEATKNFISIQYATFGEFFTSYKKLLP